jgi:hypothetical protein
MRSTWRRRLSRVRARSEQFRLEHAPKPCAPFLITPSASLGELDLRLERVEHAQDVESAVPRQARAQSSQQMQSIDHGAKKNVAPCVAGRDLIGVVRQRRTEAGDKRTDSPLDLSVDLNEQVEQFPRIGFRSQLSCPWLLSPLLGRGVAEDHAVVNLGQETCLVAECEIHGLNRDPGRRCHLLNRRVVITLLHEKSKSGIEHAVPGADRLLTDDLWCYQGIDVISVGHGLQFNVTTREGVRQGPRYGDRARRGRSIRLHRIFRPAGGTHRTHHR